jgi:hypothetical protein
MTRFFGSLFVFLVVTLFGVALHAQTDSFRVELVFVDMFGVTVIPDSMALHVKTGEHEIGTFTSVGDTTLVVRLEFHGFEIPVPPDFDGSGEVDFSDFVMFAQVFGLFPGDPLYHPKFNLDGVAGVGFGDFLRFAQAFGNKVEPERPRKAVFQITITSSSFQEVMTEVELEKGKGSEIEIVVETSQEFTQSLSVLVQGITAEFTSGDTLFARERDTLEVSAVRYVNLDSVVHARFFIPPDSLELRVQGTALALEGKRVIAVRPGRDTLTVQFNTFKVKLRVEVEEFDTQGPTVLTVPNDSSRTFYLKITDSAGIPFSGYLAQTDSITGSVDTLLVFHDATVVDTTLRRGRPRTRYFETFARDSLGNQTVVLDTMRVKPHKIFVTFGEDSTVIKFLEVVGHVDSVLVAITRKSFESGSFNTTPVYKRMLRRSAGNINLGAAYPEGPNTIVITAVDNIFGQEARFSRIFTVLDVSGPRVEITSSKINGREVSISWRISDVSGLSIVSFSLRGGDSVNNTISIPEAAGKQLYKHTYMATLPETASRVELGYSLLARDKLGHESRKTIQLAQERTPGFREGGGGSGDDQSQTLFPPSFTSATLNGKPSGGTVITVQGTALNLSVSGLSGTPTPTISTTYNNGNFVALNNGVLAAVASNSVGSITLGSWNIVVPGVP